MNVKLVNEFVYICSMFTKDDKIDMRIKRRMNAGFRGNEALKA